MCTLGVYTGWYVEICDVLHNLSKHEGGVFLWGGGGVCVSWVSGGVCEVHSVFSSSPTR